MSFTKKVQVKITFFTTQFIHYKAEIWHMEIAYNKNIRAETNSSYASMVLGTNMWKIR